jgi:hypothetical protein
MRPSGSPLVDETGRRVGMIDFAEWVTLCGKEDEDPHDAFQDHHKPRPVGVCPACWKIFRADMLAAENLKPEDLLRSLEGEPVQVVVTTGPSGVFVGTSGVVVSPLKPLKDT